MQELKLILRTYLYVLAGTLLSAALFITIFNSYVTLTVVFLWEIMAVAALSALGSLLFVSKKEISKNQMRIRNTIHYIYINIVVVGAAFLCDWVESSHIFQIIVFIVNVSLVYFVVCAIMFRKEEKTAECMNEQLRKRYPEEEKE